MEHALFHARNSLEKYLAASRYDTRASFSRELTRTRFLYVCHWLKDDINAICELLAVKHANLQLDLFRNSVFDAFVKFLGTTYFFSIFLSLFTAAYLCVLCTIFIINKLMLPFPTTSVVTIIVSKSKLQF